MIAGMRMRRNLSIGNRYPLSPSSQVKKERMMVALDACR